MAVMTATLTTFVAVSSDRTKRSIAEDAVRNLAGEITALVASNISGAVRFGKVDTIEAGEISNNQGKEVFTDMFATGKGAADVIKEIEARRAFIVA